MAYYENPGFRLGDRQEGLPKQHFSFREAGQRLEAESYKSADSAAVQERDSFNSENLRSNDNVTVDAKPFGTGVVSGTVDDGAAAVEGAVVSVLYPNGDSYNLSDETDASGNYSLDVLPGDYTVKVTADGFVDDETAVSVTEDATTTNNVSLAAV